MVDETKYRRELYIRIPRETDEALTRLAAIYGTKTAAVLTAIAKLNAEHQGRSTSRSASAQAEVKPVTGRRKGGLAPYGQRYDKARGVYVDDPDEQATLRRILELDAQGVGPTEIAKTLNAERRLARRGKVWKRNNLETILKTARGRTRDG